MQWRAYSKPRLASIHAWVCLDYTQKGNREEWLPVEHGGPVSLPGPWCLGLCSNKNEVTDWGPLWKIDTAASSLKARLRLITWAQTSLTHMHQSFIIQTLIGSVAVVPPYARWCVRACVCAAACEQGQTTQVFVAVYMDKFTSIFHDPHSFQIPFCKCIF